MLILGEVQYSGSKRGVLDWLCRLSWAVMEWRISGRKRLFYDGKKLCQKMQKLAWAMLVWDRVSGQRCWSKGQLLGQPDKQGRSLGRSASSHWLWALGDMHLLWLQFILCIMRGKSLPWPTAGNIPKKQSYEYEQGKEEHKPYFIFKAISVTKKGDDSFLASWHQISYSMIRRLPES